MDKFVTAHDTCQLTLLEISKLTRLSNMPLKDPYNNQVFNCQLDS